MIKNTELNHFFKTLYSKLNTQKKNNIYKYIKLIHNAIMTKYSFLQTFIKYE